MVAGGLETQDQVETMKSFGAGMGQGFVFAPPLTLDEAVQYAREHVQSTAGHRAGRPAVV